jgi:competence protein ComEC
MKHPAFYVLLLFISGILLGNFFDPPVVLLLSIFSLTLLFSFLFLLRKETKSVSFFLVLSIILAGFFRHELLTRNFPPNHISKFLNSASQVTITGGIVDDPDIREDKTFISLEAKEILIGKRLYPTTGQIMLKIKEPTFKFNYADNIKFNGYLYEPTSPRNPGAFDYKRYLNRRKIYGLVTLRDENQVEILDRGEENIFISKIVIPLRKWILTIFDKTLSGNHKALLAGFLLGETKEIPKRVYTMFRDTGTVHLLAVSGSNVWLVIGVIFGALSLLRVPKLPATLLIFVCIFIFTHLVHNDPPVVRAGIMAGVILLGVLLYKDVNLVNVVSFAGMVILSVSSLFLFDVGFQLSFASVFAILLLYPQLSKLVSKYVNRSHKSLWKWVIVPALISLSVELVLFPILSYYFNIIPLIIIVANIFIVPLAGLSVVLACFSIFSAIFSTSLAGIFSASNWLCLDLTLRLTEFFASLPIAKLSIPAPSAFSFILYYLLLWFLVSAIAKKRKAILFSILIVANVIVWREGLSHSNRILSLTFLDISQGSSAVFELPNGEVFLINAGEKANNFDAGEYVIVPFLNHKGITKIDKLILTNTDSLSINSARSIAENAKIEEIVSLNPVIFEAKNNGNIYEKTRISLSFLDSIKAITDNENKLKICLFDYLKTDKTELGSKKIVTKITYQNISFCLFDGMKSVQFYPEFDWDQVRNCSILVLPEIGKEDEIIKVISAIRPQKIIFTRHYFRYERDKIPVLMQFNFPEVEYHRTADNGAITCKTDGEKLRFDFTISSPHRERIKVRGK